MGWDRKEIQIRGHVSRHNSERDASDDALWTELAERVAQVVEDPKFAPLNILVNGDYGQD